MKTRRQNLHSETTVFQRGSVTCQLTSQTYTHTLLRLQMILFNTAQRNRTSTSCKEVYYGSKSEPSTIEFNSTSMRKEVICFWCKKRDDFLDNKFWISSNVHPHHAHTHKEHCSYFRRCKLQGMSNWTALVVSLLTLFYWWVDGIRCTSNSSLS